MNAFAYITVLDALLKLVVAYLLFVVKFDKLIIYAILMLCVQILDFSVYFMYCRRNFKETRGGLVIDLSLSKDVMKYTSWTLTGAVTSMTCNQGINVLLNLFFGPIVNAARGVAFQVQMVIQNFANNFQTALNPQIVKSYANGDYARINELVKIGTKFSFYLLLLISLPVILKIDFLLSVWLVEVPEYTSTFIRLLLCINLIHSALANPLIFAINATGDIKVFQIAEGICLILILPVSYLFYRLGNFSPYLVFYVYLIIEFLTQIVRMIVVLPKVKIDYVVYLKEIIMPILWVLILVAPASYVIAQFSKDTWINLFLISAVEVLLVIASVYFVGLSKDEKSTVITKINSLKFKR
jgi:O-antigen/teichoic acid export membrane protein